MRAFVRRPEADEAARALGAQPFFSPAEAARGAAVVFTNVTSSEDVRDNFGSAKLQVRISRHLTPPHAFYRLIRLLPP